MYLYLVRQIKTEVARYKLFPLPLILSFILLGALLMQCVFGNVALRYFAFPMNLIIGFGILFLLWTGRDKWWVKECSSLPVSLAGMGLMGICGLILGLFPQLSLQDAGTRNSFANLLGCYQFTTSYLFIASLLIFLWVLGSVIVVRLKVRSMPNIGFALAHFGLWLAVFAGTFGSADTYKVKLAVYRDKPARIAFEQSGDSFHLPYEIRMDNFEVIRSGSDVSDTPGYIRNYEATISVLKNDEATVYPVRVNHPVVFEGDRIYLSGYDMRLGENTRYCVLQIVRQPWEKFILAGILMMLAGFVFLFITGFRAKKMGNELE